MTKPEAAYNAQVAAEDIARQLREKYVLKEK
jgi:hypothetical protein